MATVVIYSGGSDSYTVLNRLLDEGCEVAEAVTFAYGQRHSKEIEYAQRGCLRLSVPHLLVRLDPIFGSASALTGGAVPEGFYANDNMKQTVVPNRNMVMLSIALARAVALGADVVAYGAHSGDHDIYPDCRPAFVSAMSTAFKVANWRPVQLYAPFLHQAKRDIYRWGLDHGLDYADTWTCYNGRELACGRCGACVERLHAFHDICAVDPMEYEDREYWQGAVADATGNAV